MDSVTHFEIPFDDIERAQKFYQETFGWIIFKIPEMDYYWVTTTETDHNTGIPKNPGAINGGMLPRQEPRHSPTVVINVKSLDEHLNKVTKAGGTVVFPKIQVGTHGFYAQISDTEGNHIGLWQAAGP